MSGLKNGDVVLPRELDAGLTFQSMLPWLVGLTTGLTAPRLNTGLTAVFLPLLAGGETSLVFLLSLPPHELCTLSLG